MVPQHNRRSRLIVDYTFSQVNNETVPLPPREAMQFERSLQRIFTRIVHADRRYGPVHMAKIDIADGFYRVWLQVEDIPKLGVALPSAPGSPPLVAFPLALPMGWVEFPPYFTVLTETACDLANAALKTRQPLSRLRTAHRLEAPVADTPPDDTNPCTSFQEVVPRSTLQGHNRPPVAAEDVYVDDFLLLAQTGHQQQKVMRAALTAIDDVFRPLAPSDPPSRKEPASVTKMLKGDAFWSPHKRILGWDIDTRTDTLNLPPHRIAQLYEVLGWLQPPCKRLSIKRWHQLLGELRSMAPALPGTRGLFSFLQAALSTVDRHRVRLNQQVYDTADDLRSLVASVATRPTRLQELVPTAPSDIGACDACRTGMGGVWFDALDASALPIVWLQRFPAHIAGNLVTVSHRSGTLSISDLELTGMIAHENILAQARDVTERTIWLASDNQAAAVSWSGKGSATSLAARAYLLRYNALHQRHHRYVARHHYLLGPVNVMADESCRLWYLSDDNLLTHFNTTHYSQANSWRMLTLPPGTNTALIGAVCKRRPPAGSLANELLMVPPPGPTGRPCVPVLASTPTAWAPRTQSLFSNSMDSATATALSLPVVDPSGLGQWKMPYERWARRTPGWGPWTLV